MNELIDMYDNLFTDILDHLIPFQSKKIGRKPKPWLNNNIKEKLGKKEGLKEHGSSQNHRVFRIGTQNFVRKLLMLKNWLE